MAGLTKGLIGTDGSDPDDVLKRLVCEKSADLYEGTYDCGFRLAFRPTDRVVGHVVPGDVCYGDAFVIG